jgi:Succinylglutamate desuccinylase / Aspartoacylase family
MTILSPSNISITRQGNTGVEGVWLFDSNAPGPFTVVTALIHGNEICGPWALQELIENIQNRKAVLQQGKLCLIFCNLAAFDRFDTANLHASRFVEEDMNRVWSVDKLQNASTQERKRANEILPFVSQADYLLDLHSMHDPGDPLLLTGLTTKDFEFTQKLKLPGHIIIDAGHSEGVRLRDFKPEATALLVECGFHLAQSSKLVAKQSVARFLMATGQLEFGMFNESWGLNELANSTFRAKEVAVTHAIVAKTNELKFKEEWQNMQTLPKEGQLLAVDGNTIFRTPYDNCTLIMPSLKQLRPGVTVVRLAKNVALRNAFQQ